MEGAQQGRILILKMRGRILRQGNLWQGTIEGDGQVPGKLIEFSKEEPSNE